MNVFTIYAHDLHAYFSNPFNFCKFCGISFYCSVFFYCAYGLHCIFGLCFGEKKVSDLIPLIALFRRNAHLYAFHTQFIKIKNSLYICGGSCCGFFRICCNLFVVSVGEFCRICYFLCLAQILLFLRHSNLLPL